MNNRYISYIYIYINSTPCSTVPCLLVYEEEPDGDDIQTPPYSSLRLLLGFDICPNIHIKLLLRWSTARSCSGLAAHSPVFVYIHAHTGGTIRSPVTWVRHGPLRLLSVKKKKRARCLRPRLDGMFVGNIRRCCCWRREMTTVSQQPPFSEPIHWQNYSSDHIFIGVWNSAQPWLY